ncbi:MAG: hypothetical protein JXB62_14500 [Pirellulales bacterium]|nr:hypothetical protein [Pirellulales bacterium]
MKHCLRLALAAACACGSLATACADDAIPPSGRDLREILGVTHVAGKYHLTRKEFLVEGAEQIAALGARVIKLYLKVPPREYPFNTQWPPTESLVDVARTAPYRAVLAMPFSTYILTTYSAGRGDHYWLRGIGAAEAQDETEQFYRLARHLLTEYRGSGKTFVLQPWEGDWAIRGSFDRKADPTAQAIEGMIGWLNARQAGVDRARSEVGQNGVRVFHAAEVNLVRIAMLEHRPTVTTDVLPHTRVDLVSYSAWDTQENPQEFRRALDYIARYAPDRDPFGGRNVYVGEFGLPENERSAEQMRRVVPDVIDTAVAWGCPFVVYWQLYCNEARRQPVRQNDDVRGFWLIRPDGSKSWVWHELQRRLEAVGQPAAEDGGRPPR